MRQVADARGRLRLYGRRLREAMAGVPADPLAARTAFHPLVVEALEDRHFNEHGRLPGTAGLAAARTAARMLQTLRKRHQR